MTLRLFSQAASVSRSSPRLIAKTASPWSLKSRWTCSIVEGNSLAQYGQPLSQK